MDQKMANEEEDFNAMLGFENPEVLKDDYLVQMIEKTEITEASYEYQYTELQNAYWNVQLHILDTYNLGLVRLDCRKLKS